MKKHTWIDGALYDRFVTPGTDWLMESILELIPISSRTLEIGCGPGELACRMGKKCRSVTAVDISERMIEYARRKAKKLGAANVEFVCIGATEIKKTITAGYDYAIASFCLHEMTPLERTVTVSDSLGLADKMIIADYRAPFPRSFVALGNITMEVLAGTRHHRNFKNWQSSGGIDGLIEMMNLRIVQELRWKDRCGKTIVVSR
jgi:SAM-dependent methyltransferase